ncbi:DUF1566 domain-containing protein [Reichenbachiella agarivorans]|uniref:DUF1566 domain-containing protein n=1 Tax=Reichenbachiella agarivorans TaxID=2979464 RepID=A0ABY6CQC5_9BACT|nr:DUF1566 domain-containing protein [Reichenbachiella agarivorans]UXP32722.1 DUF1566 domain-containing protein [Reichenbachiella agarivorans]
MNHLETKTFRVFMSSIIFRAGMCLFYAVLIFASVTSCKEDESLSDSITVTVEDFSVRINEEPSAGQILGTVEASTSEGEVSFALTTQSIEGAMAINATTGQLTVAKPSAFDYETNPTITGTVTVSNGDVAETGSIMIILTDIDEEGIVRITTQDFSVTIAENPTQGALLGTLSASSSDGAAVTFTISSETPVGALDINGGSGEVTVADESLFNYETLPTYENLGKAAKATVTVSNGTTSVAINVTIVVTDVVELGGENFSISVQDFTLTMQENLYSNGETLGYISWSVISGAAAPDARANFTLETSNPVGSIDVNGNGEVLVADEQYFNYELYPTITATVIVDVPGEMGGYASASGTITITLTDDTNETAQDRLNDGETPLQLYYDGVAVTDLYGLSWGGGAIAAVDINSGNIIVRGATLSGTYTWANADAAIRNLAINYHQGYNDWRMPSLTDRNTMCEAFEDDQDTEAYPIGGYFWTSTVATGSNYNMFSFDATQQCLSYVGAATLSTYAFPVRTAADPNFQNN